MYTSTVYYGAKLMNKHPSATPLKKYNQEANKMLLKEQNFGVEIELTGITRERAAAVIAQHYGTASRYDGGCYCTYSAKDTKHRTWKAMRDRSIRCERKNASGHTVSASMEYSCEVVTPILQYEDIEDLQAIVRELVAEGAMANSSCGIHVHVDGARHTPESLTRLLNFAVGRQDLIYEALQIGARENQWCHKVSRELLKAMKRDGIQSRTMAEQTWYSRANDGYTGGVDHQHYNSTRYHGINLHAFWTKGTVEFRLFNGTTHAGKIKAYVQFCLGMSAWAIECDHDDLFFRNISGYTAEQKAAIMKRVLIRRLGMSGKEFATARQHLTSAFVDAALSSAIA